MSQCFDLTRSSSNRVWIGGGLPAPSQLDDDRTYWTNYTCPPRIHLTSFLWQMLLPYFSSLLYFHVLLSYYQLKLKKKRRGRPVNGARKMGAVSMQITVGFAAECNTLSCYVCSTGPVVKLSNCQTVKLSNHQTIKPSNHQTVKPKPLYFKCVLS